MDFKDFTAGPDDSKRLDKVIRKFMPESSLSSLYKFIRKGLIKVNHKKTTPEYHVNSGDIISIASFIFSQQDEDDKTLVSLPPVIFQNQHIIIFDKPYDMTVQGDETSLDRLVQQDFKQNHKNESLSFTPGPLHRLDRKTTGLITFSQSLIGAQWFSENIKNHTIGKKYITVLQGKLEQTEEWNDFITKSEDNNNKTFHTVKASLTETDNSKPAHTICTPLAYGNFNGTEFTLAQMDIKTGRTHQIRSQSALHNHPLLGDTAYGGKELSSQYPSFFLQAYILTFPEDNSVELPPTLKIPCSNALKSFLKYCDVEYSGI